MNQTVVTVEAKLEPATTDRLHIRYIESVRKLDIDETSTKNIDTKFQQTHLYYKKQLDTTLMIPLYILSMYHFIGIMGSYEQGVNCYY